MKTQNSTIEKIYKSKRKRKVVKGSIRDAAKTKGLLLDAFAEILTEKDMSAITVTNIHKKSNRDKKLIYDYFGGLNQLKNAYEKSRNFEEVEIESDNIVDRLIHEFDEQCENIELQGNIFWSLSERRKKTAESLENRFRNVINDGTNEDQVSKALIMAGLTYLAMYKNILIKIYVEGKSQKEVAEENCISLSNVKVRLKRAKGILISNFVDCCRYEIDSKGKLRGESRCQICG
ncbi:sigma factor-like helix-turn-helix DNA-binding protein [Chryseobacterium sp. TY4]